MKKILMISMLGAATLMSSCGLYKQYERPSVNAKGLYRDSVSARDTLAARDTTSFGNLPWKSVFTDASLQQLIETGLKNNVDMLTSALTVQQAEVQLKAARLSFWPSFSFGATGTLSSWDFGKAGQVYSLPVTASWTTDLFGSLTNAKRAQQTVLLQSKDYQCAVRTKLIANIANGYYTLLMLDRQKQITDSTVTLYKHTLDMTKAMKEYGQTDEASVQSIEGAYYAVQASIPELEREIREAENSLSLLIGQAPQMIGRSTLAEQSLPETFSVGIPVQMLSNRPDVHQAEMNLANCYYQVNEARAAFYPNITITGSAAWTNSTGASIVNPGKILASAVASLTQPIFAKGKLRAALKVAQFQQEAAYITWQYDILNAGSEVSNALVLYQSSKKKSDLEQSQIGSLTKSVDFHEKLFKLGSSTYLDVITAQQSLLQAQLSKINDDFYKMQAVVNLYYALGGGR
jgi:outer membrane protein, multidrug efflux system